MGRVRHTAAGLCGVLVITAGCSSAPNPPAAAPVSLERLAARIGCAVTAETNAAELRQGSCSGAQGRYVLLTFATPQNQDAWLTEARQWGGHYLAGTRWVIVGTPAQLKVFQAGVGGAIVAGDDHAGHVH
ncbi:MAG: hypothetical protein JWN00_6199 [Actinomycetia bacterium]|nr:hypothetical protein [Actinomycetes bacterium]